MTSGGLTPSDTGAPDMILMGADLAARGLLTVTKLGMIGDSSYSPTFGGHLRRLVVETKVFGGNQEEKLELLLTSENVQRLRKLLDWWTPPGTSEPDA
ncbi:hypothetical protein ACFVYA_24490 [Amycolatopsis sp. NPDC058278]|uniref:hypothetical protein n=1 Tax=Amycolatopsis sp. NPDC058278 TaxID=3346417 RepID=UPI0036DF46D4